MAGLLGETPPIIDRETLAADLAACLRETPSISPVFGSPLDRAVTKDEVRDVQFTELLNPEDPSGRKARDATLSKASAAFESWKPERFRWPRCQR